MHRTCNAICTLLQPKMMIFAVTVKHRNWECFNESHAQTILKTRKIDMAILSAQMGKNPGIYSVSMRRFLQKTIFRVLVGIRNFYVILIVFLFPLPGTAGSTTRGTAGSTTRQRTHLQGRGSPSHHQQYSGSRISVATTCRPRTVAWRTRSFCKIYTTIPSLDVYKTDVVCVCQTFVSLAWTKGSTCRRASTNMSDTWPVSSFDLAPTKIWYHKRLGWEDAFELDAETGQQRPTVRIWKLCSRIAQFRAKSWKYRFGSPMQLWQPARPPSWTLTASRAPSPTATNLSPVRCWPTRRPTSSRVPARP